MRRVPGTPEAGPPRASAETSLCWNVVISLGAGLGSVLLPTLAAAQTQAAKPGGSGQLGLRNVPLPAASAADRLSELGPENAAMAAYTGLWDHRDGVG
jgi:hypothetical protein